MARKHVTLALACLLGGAALLSPELASAAPPTPPRPTQHVPTTPIPMNLPDDATEAEVREGYAVGVAGLVVGAVLLIATMLGGFYVVSRHSWSTTH
jgi:hypothetical protein